VGQPLLAYNGKKSYSGQVVRLDLGILGEKGTCVIELYPCGLLAVREDPGLCLARSGVKFCHFAGLCLGPILVVLDGFCPSLDQASRFFRTCPGIVLQCEADFYSNSKV
jgi:hypothetical protein